METLVRQLEDILTKKLEGSDTFLVELKVLPGNKVQVFVDSDTGLTIDRCAELSRYLEFHIEENKWLPENYTLEVSSPGVGQPLKMQRQYAKNIGRTVEVTDLEGQSHTGTLLEVGEEHLLMEEELAIPGKKKKEKKNTEIPFITIKKTVVKLNF